MAMAALLLGSLSPASPLRAAPPEDGLDAAALVASLAREAPARTPYTEVRFSSVLERPLVLHGELAYLGPGHLGKRVDRPYREETTVADGEAVVRRGTREPRRFALGQAPELEGFLRGFSALLGGDAAALARDFTLAAHGSTDAWRLVLAPRDRRLARRVRRIEVDGSGNTPRCFRTESADGDVGVLMVDGLAGVDLPARPSTAQVSALCRAAP
jgi:hypothetical protein